jgi:hypothetical protein
MLRVFELIALDDSVPRFLLASLERLSREGRDTNLIEIDVSAYAPRLQRTLLELGFLPAAYVPAMVFSDVERLDIVRMVRLFVPPEFSAVALSEHAQAVAEAVLRPFVSQRVLPEIERVVSELPLLRGLDPEQVRRLAGACRVAQFAAGDAILHRGGEEPTLFILLNGEAEVWRSESAPRVGVVRAGECVGEMSLLTGQPHSASVVASEAMQAAALSHEDLAALVRARPDIGLVIFRNLAIGLGSKLGRASHV